MKTEAFSSRVSGCIPKPLLLGLALGTSALVCPAAVKGLGPDVIPTIGGNLTVHPVNHASLALEWQGQTLLIDPVGGAKRFASFSKPSLILVTDIHGDHLDAATLSALVDNHPTLIVPQAVAAKLPADLGEHAVVLTNGQSKAFGEIKVEAVPMYNLTQDRLKFHAKGRGNGYVLTFADKRVYLSGDTEDIPEMRALKNIDVAFVCMNLPYTMTPDQAASAVREFKPKVVYPYHYRGSDVDKFKQLVGQERGVEVRLRDWYK